LAALRKRLIARANISPVCKPRYYTTAIAPNFHEVDMKPVYGCAHIQRTSLMIAWRRLGFMSFFMPSLRFALHEWPCGKAILMRTNW